MIPKCVRIVLLCCILLVVLGVEIAAPVSEAASPSVLLGHARRGLTTIAIDDDGALLAAGDEDSTLYLWDVSTGNLRHSLHGHAGAPVAQVAFSPDGNILASAGADSVVRLWDVASGQLLRELMVTRKRCKRWPSAQTARCWHPAVRIRTFLWEVTTGRLLRSLERARRFRHLLAFPRMAHCSPVAMRTPASRCGT